MTNRDAHGIIPPAITHPSTAAPSLLSLEQPEHERKYAPALN